MSSELTSTSWFSESDTSSKETSPCSFIVSSPTELSTSAVAVSDSSDSEELINEQGEVSLDEVSEQENQVDESNIEDTEASNS